MPKYIAAIDQGTTSTRFMIFDHAGKVVGVDQKEHLQIYPQPGWVEHNPLEIWERTQEVIAGALNKSGIHLRDIAAVGVTNQRETTVGPTRYINKGHLARAALEATAYQTREVLDAMNKDSGVSLTALRVDGGMVQNELLMQFQADMLGVPVIRPTVAETTSLGAAYAAGLAVGFWKKLEDLRAYWSQDKEWRPAMTHEERERLYRGWLKAVTRTFDWVE